ncbi:MAG: serine hydrolase, partial [bacterium]|nr:serine hydrolase [bacterium]
AKPVVAEVEAKTMDPGEKLTAELKSVIPELMDEALIPGMSFALIRNGSIAWLHEFGVKDADSGESVEQDTVFEAASLSKPIFAYGVMKLVQEGKLDLDKPFLDFVSREFLERKDLAYKTEDERLGKLTARHVLTHSTGFPNWFNGGKLVFKFEPGEKFSYSGEAFSLLAFVVESVTGESLVEFSKERIFEPLGMKDSSYVWQDDYEGRIASSHNSLGDVTPRGKNTTATPGASLYTTARDYAIFLEAIVNGVGLKKEIHDEMLSPQIDAYTDRVEGISWGLGFGLNTTDQGLSIWHWGDNGEFKCYFEILKEEKLGTAFFVNSDNCHAISGPVTQKAISLKAPAIRAFDYPGLESAQIRLNRMFIRDGGEDTARLFAEIDEELQEKVNQLRGQASFLGSRAIENRDFDGAEEFYSAILKADPENQSGLTGMADVSIGKGDSDRAKEFVLKAKQLDPESSTAKYLMAKLEPAKIDQIDIDPILGEYLRESGNSRVWQEDGKLFASSAGVMEMYPISNDTFMARWGTSIYEITFQKDESGQVTAYKLDVNGQFYSIRKRVK